MHVVILGKGLVWNLVDARASEYHTQYLEAYNKKDLTSLLSFYADDATYIDLKELLEEKKRSRGSTLGIIQFSQR